MIVDQILKKSGHLTINEKRVSSSEYEEWVVYAKDIEQWDAIFSNILCLLDLPWLCLLFRF